MIIEKHCGGDENTASASRRAANGLTAKVSKPSISPRILALQYLKVLAAAGSDFDVPNSDGHTPVFAAITHCRLDCLRALSALGAKLNRRDISAGNTPAMVAASHGQTSCLRFIVKREGRRVLSDRNNDGLSSACFAVLCGREETLAAIAEVDVSLFLEQDPKGRSPPHYAAAEGKVDCLRIMADACIAAAVAAEASSAAVRVTGWFNGHPRKHYPFIACVDAQGESPLHVAARAGHTKAFAYLAKNTGLRPENSNALGRTCLWIAAANNRVRG